MNHPISSVEAQRLQTLRQYDVLDTPPEPAFDDLTLLASYLCQTPMAWVSLVDEKRQWFKSRIGVNETEMPRETSFCTHTILQKNEILEVNDAQADARFAASPLVTTEPFVRFYAGAPLIAPDGHILGALCVMDRIPRKLDHGQLNALNALSRRVIAQLELSQKARALSKEIAERELAEIKLRQQFDQLALNKAEVDRLLQLAQKSRQALLSVVEDEKQAGQNLRESEEKFRLLAENIHEVLWINDPQKKEMLYVSPAYEKIWGRACHRLYTETNTWEQAIHPADRERILKASAEKAALGTYDEEFRIVRPDNEIRWIHERAFPIHNAGGVLYRIVGTAEDITARKKVEEQFRQSQKMESIGQLAGGVAHDFNNILAVIQLQSELLKSTPNLPAKQIEYADEIGATVQRAAALTRQLLLFSRQEVFQPCNLNLGQSITAMAKMLQRILGDSVEIIFHLAAQPMFIHADAGMMDQILLNLVVNARDAMPNGGKVTIETNGVELDEFAAAQFPQTRTGSFVRLSVIDTGNGIPPEVLPKIFEPFFTTKGVGKGTGLGLATVFGIVQQHQGWINVYSKVGHGTTFRIFLPRLAQNTEAKPVQKALEVMHGGAETILLAEDDPTLRAAIKSILSHVGYRILEASTGVQALEIWQQNRETIHLLLADLVMPDNMTGKELARRILRENPGLKVIYMSGYSTETNDTNFLLKEGVNFLTKPFQALKLTETIRRKLDTGG